MTFRITGTLPDWHVGETYSFKVVCQQDGVALDITGDTLTCRIKENLSDTDANAKVSAVADVATEGATGTAIFTITSANTKALTAKSYYMDVEWVRSGNEYIPYSGIITLLERVSDVPA